jgi:suppressor for copper-sensitivity B
MSRPAPLLRPAVFVLLALGQTAAGAGAADALARPEKAKLALQTDHPDYRVGATAHLAALVAIEPGWHVNSHQPSFDYLIATNLELALPPGWTAAALRYPPDELKRFTFAEQPLAVYDGDVTIETDVSIPRQAVDGSYPLRASLTYQACNDSQCLPPVTTQASLSLRVATAGPGRSGGPSAPGVSGAGRDDASAQATAGAGRNGASSAPGAAGPAKRWIHSPLGAGAGAAREGGAGSAAGATAPAAAAGAGGPDPSAGQSAPATTGGPGTRPAPAAGTSLAAILLLALAGGLILNAMPCVLPVVSLKVFGLLRSAAEGRREMVRGGLATTAGILASFWALAAIAAASAAAGKAAGWGVQFQSPGFVAFLAVVILLFCLNLWGLFEIRLPQALTRVPGAAPREGLAGHFASGLFATLMATPCSAPFLGTALGFALAQPAPVIFAVFTAVGIGLSLPYLLLAAVPGAVRFFPRPGPWMETLRGAMGFLLTGSVIWLLYVLSAQVSPERLAVVELGLIAVGFVTWLQRHAGEQTAAETVPASASPSRSKIAAGRFPRAAAWRRATRWGGFAGIAALAAGLVLAAGAGAGTGGAGSAGSVGSAMAVQPAGLIQWVSFDRARAEALAASGQLVFVDVTAQWCFTCKVNERWVLETPEVAGAFSRHNVLAMRADWTNHDERIAGFLAEHGRYGIPFYLLYRPGQSPYVFSEVPTKQSVVRAIAEAAGRRSARAPAPAGSPNLGSPDLGSPSPGSPNPGSPGSPASSS